jgi:hypothetical protein
MHHTIDPLGGQNFSETIRLPQIDLKEGNIGRQRRPMALPEIVDDRDPGARRTQMTDGVRADISRAPGDQNIHGRLRLSRPR